MYRQSRKILIPVLALLFALGLNAKRVLTHDDLDGWKAVKNQAVSRDGVWSAYSTAPQAGDVTLVLYNVVKGNKIEVARGASPAFSADSRWAIALIKPLYAETRSAKIEKKKGYEMPQDSLAIIDLTTGRIERIANVTGYQLGENDGHWLAYQSCDTLHIKKGDLKKDDLGRPLVLRDLKSPATRIVKWVKEYTMSKDGRRVAFSLSTPEKDSIYTSGIGYVNLPDTSLLLIDRDRKHYGAPVFDTSGDQLAYTASDDTTATGKCGTRETVLYYASLNTEPGIIPQPIALTPTFSDRQPVNLMPARPTGDDRLDSVLRAERLQAIRESMGREYRFNQYTKPEFSHNGRRLIAGVGPVIAPDDTTIVKFERARLDIWRWDSPTTPPQEKAQSKKTREHTMPVVFEIDNDFKYRLITKVELATVTAPDRWDGDWALVSDPSQHYISRQWDYQAPEELKVVNVVTGESRHVGEAPEGNYELSPSGKFVIYFVGKQYFCYEIATGKTVEISSSIPYPLWDVDNDRPGAKEPYGYAAWMADDAAVLLYDKYDIWSVDPRGIRTPVCLTGGTGRKDNRQYRYRRTDKEERNVCAGQTMLLNVHDFTDKRNGFATIKAGDKATTPQLRLLDTYTYTGVLKAKNADTFTWLRGNFETIPELWYARSYDFAKGRQITDINAQKEDISWGTAELVHWEAYDGTLLEGVLYKPEGFDAAGSYPLLSVFYERNAEQLYRHYTMEPSWSWINYPFYVSRGYMVFVPDIVYHPGRPGEDAYNCVCSGIESLCERYPAIDRSRIGIDGQSWGGYQTAYLITRTDMFACAGSGAPVANMTSAFGGIRWGSGDSRQAQYEMGQSRIGRNLWEAPQLYIANSPVFYADRVKTPLLIMHNDNDGAVPWYQGIELFMALRRLQKPVWMLQYNDEQHNLKERRNCKDITIRLQQFFDHYLKGTPMPRWMREGVPYNMKTQDLGY